MMKKLRIGLLVFSILLLLLWVFSNFKLNPETNEYSLENSILIQSPVEKIFTYLGNSANASSWSSFVDHITPLNQNQIPDGQLNSTRRCFRNADETGIQWDEDIVKWEANKLRELSIYNMKHFPVSTGDLRTRQQYDTQPDGSVKLTFGLYKSADKTTWTDVIKMKYTGYIVAGIFKANISNIKREIEKP
ncbi:MAG TPA: hypothetical protein DCF33_16525 [Saprospirales bacterium]|nr:hypothetical protein [Saprospirales bacterium]